MSIPRPNFSQSQLNDIVLLTKYLNLKNRLLEFPKVLIGFSGGVDSTLLMGIARETLGKERVLACLAVGPSLPKQEQKDAIRLARLLDVTIKEYSATEFDNPDYVKNGPDRCFHCKADLFQHLQLFAKNQVGARLLYGGNADDIGDFRPGRRAALDYGALAPLAEVGLTKFEVRALSKAFSLPTADKAAQPCLSSRIPYGSSVNPSKLAMIEAGEILLGQMGFREYRLRHFGETARIEIPLDQFGIFELSNRKQTLLENLKKIGFTNMEIDPEGFRSGSLNENLSENQKNRFT